MGTKIWGPLGWMTLHSISAIYPENPTVADRLLLEEFMGCFRETIACPYCKNHFTSMFTRYKHTHPEWSSNRRLDKPIYKTVGECISTLRNATVNTSPAQFRKAYLDYLTKNWSRQTDSEGFLMMGFVRKMIKINDEYFTPRDTGYAELQIQDGDVMEFIQENTRNYRASEAVPDPIHYRNLKIGFRAGSFVRR
jgi:hypothetical protein